MSDYDFKPLNDKEFEILCADLLGNAEGHRFERFKAGKDGGVDGRYFAAQGKEVILQCKHWSATPLPQLIRELENTEKPKLDKLNPHRYLLAVSNPLSRSDKKTICRLLAPHIKSETDIFGKEDLNDLLKSNAQIEQRHYKLWLHSTNVLKFIQSNALLGRSAFSLEEIIRSSRRYVVTANHEAALNILEKSGVVIITGEPGVGKTTLADHLCLHYITQEFEFLKVADDLKEAESAFDPESKQVIYFDDFLGRNYLDALKGHEGNHITQFIRRVASNKNKRFILTSRSTILNQGKFLIDELEHSNVKRNEYELRIQSLTELDKAQILYNHIWHSELGSEYREQIYFDRRYRQIIDHRNFNPRLISYVTDATRLETCKPDTYWSYIVESLTNPSHVWDNPFNAQLDDFCRAIVLLVVLNGHAITESDLSEAYHRWLAIPENHSLQGRREFLSNMRLLTGSFLNRTISPKGASAIDLFNPSIGDYVLQRYLGDMTTLRYGMLSLRTTRSIATIQSLLTGKRLSKANAQSLCEALISNLTKNSFEGAQVPYVSALCNLYRISGGLASGAVTTEMRNMVFFIVEAGLGYATDDSFAFVAWGIEQDIISPKQAINFAKQHVDSIDSKEEIQAISSLLNSIPDDTPDYQALVESVTEHVIELFSSDMTNFIDTDSAFSSVDYGDERTATREIEKLIEDKLVDMGIDYSSYDVTRILDSFDVADGLQSYFENNYRDDDQVYSEGPEKLAIDEIDDLFDRS